MVQLSEPGGLNVGAYLFHKEDWRLTSISVIAPPNVAPGKQSMSESKTQRRMGLIVPALEHGGGVPAVAKFVLDVALRNGYQVKLISLATSSVDECSKRLAKPSTWLRGAFVRSGTWRSMTMQHVGAEWTEFEFQRYKPRKALAALVADCDLLQVVSGTPAWANAVIGEGRPLALQVATRAKVERRRLDAHPKTLAGWWRKAMTFVTDRLDDRAIRGVDALQLENLWMLDYCKLINSSRNDVDIRYAPPGVDARVFYPVAARLSNPKPYVLCVGRLDDPRKNINYLLRAFNRLPSSLAHVQLVTAGSGKPPLDYWRQVEKMGLTARVRHVHRPTTDELVKLYQQATVLALSSDEEGLGVVILEAMACAVPVVATRCGGPEGIITDGMDGLLVPLDDEAEFAERLTVLCSDLERNQRMGQCARATIEARFAEEVAGQSFVDVWAMLLQKAGVR